MLLESGPLPLILDLILVSASTIFLILGKFSTDRKTRIVEHYLRNVSRSNVSTGKFQLRYIHVISTNMLWQLQLVDIFIKVLSNEL